MRGVLPKVSETSEHAYLAVLALLDPVLWSSARLRGQGRAPTVGFSPISRWSKGTGGSAGGPECFEQLRDIFSHSLLEKQSSVAANRATRSPFGDEGLHPRACWGTLTWQPSLLWDRNHSVLDLQPPTTILTLPLGPACPNNSVITLPSTYPSITTHFSQVFSKCNLCVLYLSLIDQPDVFLFWTNSHYI